MRTLLKKHWNRFTIGISASVVLFASLWVWGQGVPQPVLTIAPLGSNQLSITITNADSAAVYELYAVPVLDDLSYPWTLCQTGAIGQSNFTVSMGLEPAKFIRAAVGADWDSDGVPNWMDANPNDPNVRALAVVIDSPVNGTELQ